MTQAIRAAIVPGIIVIAIIFSWNLVQAQQQQRKTISYPDGSKDIFDTTTGWTQIDKSGKTTNATPAEVTSLCSDLEAHIETVIVHHLMKDTEGERVVCDEWAKLQPQTQIERVPFRTFIARLFVVTPPSTDFARYRGLELQSTKEGKAYDAIILPNDIGNDISCTIKEATLPDRTFNLYDCSIKTSSYQDAIQLEERLVHLLDPLKLAEDQVDEHGESAQAREENRCAPTGECEGQYLYATSWQDGKMLKIGANPDFTRTVDDLELSLKTGRDLISGISPNSATVSIEVYSVGPKKADTVTKENSTSQSNP